MVPPDTTAPATPGEGDHFINLAAANDVHICDQLIESILLKFGLKRQDLGGVWQDVRAQLICGACSEASQSQASNRVGKQAVWLETAIIRLHARSAVRAALSMNNDGSVTSVTVENSAVVVNGVTDASLETPSIAAVITKLVAELRKNPKRLGYLDVRRASS